MLWGRKKPECCTCSILEKILKELKKIRKLLQPRKAVALNLKVGTPTTKE